MMETDQLLQQIKQVLDERISPVEKHLTDLKNGQVNMQHDIDSIKASVHQTNLIIDEDIRKSISRVAEGHQMLAEKMSKIDLIADDVEEIKGAIVAVEAGVVKNRTNIIDLQNAKTK